MAAKKGLGRGLGSLITSGSEELFTADQAKQVEEIEISKVEPDSNQPRKEFDQEKINELAESIQHYGVLQPLLVQRAVNANGEDYFKIIAGERRWRAALKAGLTKVPAIVKDYSSAEIFEISLIENIQREDLNPLEEAMGYDRLINEYHLTQDDIAGHVGKSRPAIANSLRLLSLGAELQKMVASGALSVGHAKVLLGVDDEKKQLALANRVIEENLSVRALENLLKSGEGTETKKDKKASSEKEPDQQTKVIFDNISREMRDIFGTKVNIVNSGKTKKIEIEYYSDDDLDRLLSLLRKAK